MRVRIGTLLVPAVLAAALARPAQAQTLEAPRPRQNYYLGGGLNLLTTDVIDHGESQGLWYGASLSLRVGQMLTQRLGLGLNIDYGATARDPESAYLGGLALEGQWEIIDNLALRGSAGLAVVELFDDSDPQEELRGVYGGVYALGLSYDLFVHEAKLSGGLALQPILWVRYVPDDTISVVTVTLGLELMWWSGLPNNQLELAPGQGYDKK